MQSSAKVTDILKQKSACVVLAVDAKNQLTESGKAADKAAGGLLGKLLKRGDLGKSVGSTLAVPHIDGIAADRLLLVRGTGKTSAADFRKMALASANAIKGYKDATSYLAEVSVEDCDASWQASQIALAAGRAVYKFTECKSGKQAGNPLAKLTVHAADKKAQKAVQAGCKLGDGIAHGTNVARHLANLPGNICTPMYLTKQAKELAKKDPKVKASAIGEKKMAELGMGSFLSVSKGSDQEGQMITIEYNGGKKGAKPVVLVGKGITFDTGGISLKPGAGMDEMKFDMGGAASVMGTMNALVELQPKINVVAIIAAAENMPSGGASKPGDIVTSMAGKTIEILNTDAEGRLVLCDALTYAAKFKPKAVIDIATLTGACVIALGHHATGLYANQDGLAEELIAAGETTGDRAWRMPLWDDYQPQLDSNFADMQNIGGRDAGSVTAACFLARFAEDYRWAHLDIAGSAWNSGAAKGATGRPVPLLVQYLLDNA
ncbi:leucyl aminopeptidase [Biformimicrobium ophioploci]|uniref:Probable cytosol aminopeptidase n=1 Tax=Biformimicrobium ophioploci TaxID=3036711 RepID=A0ABQ6LXE8_9GAMM|nr:leucyl aminopeptidase [Microbulbifer sp. NKW57]GMG86738.1 leucyl aminopeptidase [Microbulbifer sp. NKW57]